MARPKKEEPVKELFVVMKAGRERRTVKAWQYYSIYEFIRGCGVSREKADEIARWCREKATDGDRMDADEGFTIRIEEREIPA